MQEYSIIEERIERAQEVSRRIIDAIPSVNSYMPASVSSIMEEIKYKQEKVTYGKRQGSNQFEEIKREPYKNEKNEVSFLGELLFIMAQYLRGEEARS